MIGGANKLYGHLNNEYEIVLTADTQVFPWFDNNDEIPNLSFNFTKIYDIQSKIHKELIGNYLIFKI